MKLSVTAIQLPAAVESIEGRSREVEASMRFAAAQGARFVVLPELSLTGYEFGPRADRAGRTSSRAACRSLR